MRSVLLNRGTTKCLTKILLLIILLVTSAPGYSKKMNYSLEHKFTFAFNQATIKSVFDYIESTSEFIFMYHTDALDVSRKVSIKVEDVDIEGVLDILLKGTSVTYQVNDRQIILKKNTEVKPQIVGNKAKLTITGNVSDENGIPVIGANVVVKNMNGVGVVTDIDGKFSMEMPEGAETLVVSFIGYTNQEVSVKNSDNLNIVLSENTATLDEVQIVAYGVQKKVTVTGAISSVGTDEILKTPVASMGNALSGKLPGLSAVQYSGQPGGDTPDLYIRGDANPLVLVDGVERDFYDIDPNEVEDITILKDASATAVFGVRGANGVILVTTKRGEKGKAKVNLSSSFGMQLPTRLLEFADSYNYAMFYNEAVQNDNPGVPDKFTPEMVQAFKDGSNPLIYPNTNWVDYLLKDMSFQTQHNINISGGTDKMRYFVSAGFLFQNGLFKTFESDSDSNFKYKRYNYRANLDFDISKTTSLSIGIGGRVGNKNRPLVKDDADDELFRLIYWATPFSGSGIDDQGRWIKSYGPYFPVPVDPDGLDAYYGRGYKTQVSNTLNADVDFKQKLDFITKGLSLGIKGAYNSDFVLSKKRNRNIPYYQSILDEKGNVILRKIGDESMPGYSEETAAARNWYAEIRLNYNRKFGKHDVGALLLYNQSKNYYPAVHPEIPRGYVGLVGRLTYNYATKYLIDFNMGYNGSENFAEGHRFGFLPAASVGWILSEEKFMKNQNVIDYLKLRASYGVVGNDRMDERRFLYLPDSYAFGGGYNFGVNTPTNQPGAFEDKTGNPLVTWEMAYKQNYGFDIIFLQDRLKVNFDYFYEKRKNQLITRNRVPSCMAIQLPAVNMGERENKGYEIAVSWKDEINSDWRYFVNMNLAYARNKILEMDEVPPQEDYMRRTGLPEGQPFGRIFWGFYDETANERYKQQFGTDIANHGVALKPGDCVYVDLNHDGVINAFDQKAIGYSDRPEYNGGVTLGFSYRNFDFSMLWNYAWNSSRMLRGTFREPLGDINSRSLMQSMYDNRWTPETAATATLPRATLDNKINNYVDSDLWLVNANYLRLKNIEMSYTFDSKSLKNVGVDQFRIFLSGYNLLTFDKLKIADPESNTGMNPEYPVMRVFNLGIKIGF